MSLNFDSLAKSIESLERSVKAANTLNTSDEDLQETVRAGVIHSFEVAYEQSWKMIKRWLQENIGEAAAEGITQRNLFRLGAESQLISDSERWMEYREARNLTSHTYNEDAAENVFTEATEFIYDAKQLLKALEERND